MRRLIWLHAGNRTPGLQLPPSAVAASGSSLLQCGSPLVRSVLSTQLMLGPLTALASCLARSGHAQAAAPFIALAGVRWGPSTWRRPYTTTHVTLDSIMVVPMPSLSHAMTHGTISKWHKAAGDKVHMYDILLEVSTDSLVEEAYKVGDFAGTVTLLVESQEDGVLAHILVPEGQQVPIGTPIAIINEDAAAAPQQQQQQQQQKSRAEGPGYTCPTSNVYDPQQPSVRVLEWQSYLKDSTKPAGSDCGCM